MTRTKVTWRTNSHISGKRVFRSRRRAARYVHNLVALRTRNIVIRVRLLKGGK